MLREAKRFCGVRYAGIEPATVCSLYWLGKETSKGKAQRQQFVSNRFE